MIGSEKEQLTAEEAVIPNNLKGQIAIVTGASYVVSPWTP